MRREKQVWSTREAGYLGQSQLSKRRTLWVGQPGSFSSCVAGMCLFNRDVFEADTLAIKSSMSGTYIAIRKTNCLVLSLQGPPLVFLPVNPSCLGLLKLGTICLQPRGEPIRSCIVAGELSFGRSQG